MKARLFILRIVYVSYGFSFLKVQDNLRQVKIVLDLIL